MGVDTSQAIKVRYSCLVKMSLCVVRAIIPITAALFATNLVFIIKYGGILAPCVIIGAMQVSINDSHFC